MKRIILLMAFVGLVGAASNPYLTIGENGTQYQIDTNWITVPRYTITTNIIEDIGFTYDRSPRPTLTITSDKVDVKLSYAAMRKLLKSGYICKVAGHNWQTDFNFSAALNSHKDSAFRICSNCNTQQVLTTEWQSYER